MVAVAGRLVKHDPNPAGGEAVSEVVVNLDGLLENLARFGPAGLAAKIQPGPV